MFNRRVAPQCRSAVQQSTQLQLWPVRVYISPTSVGAIEGGTKHERVQSGSYASARTNAKFVLWSRLIHELHVSSYSIPIE
jgi:hypothetical protein